MSKFTEKYDIKLTIINKKFEYCYNNELVEVIKTFLHVKKSTRIKILYKMVLLAFQGTNYPNLM